MAQEATATGGAAIPEGSLFRAWLEVAIHPKFTTFQRWFPLMTARWRRTSLLVSLILILITVVAQIALAAYSANRTIESLTVGNIFAYLASPSGLFRAFFYGPCAILTLFAIPAAVTLISLRSLGPYVIRFKRIFRPWMQVQPVICVFLLFSVVAQLVLMLVGVDGSASFLSAFVIMLLVVAPLLATWSYSVAALSAGSGRKPFLTGLVAAIPALAVYAIFWVALSAVLK